MEQGKGNVASIAFDIFSQLIKTPLDLSKEWGDLPKTAMGILQKLNFMGDWAAFVEFLNSKNLSSY